MIRMRASLVGVECGKYRMLPLRHPY